MRNLAQDETFVWRHGSIFRAAQYAGMPDNNLREVRRRFGLKQPEIADRMGVSVPQISRWESGRDAIPSTRLPSLSEAYQATIGELFDPGAIRAAGPQLFVKGRVAAGVWADAYEWPEDEWKSFTGRADVTAKLEHRFGLEVIGESMNIPYPHGTIVECVSILGGAELSSGKRVVVIRERDDGELEATVKEYVVDRDGVEWLWPRSTHPDFQQPWRMDQQQPGIARVEVVAVVKASIRPE